MRQFLLAILIILCPPVLAAEITGQFDAGVSVTLTDEPCTSAIALRIIKPEWHARFHAGTATFPNRTIVHCWAIAPDGAHIILVDEEGDVTPVDIRAFADNPTRALPQGQIGI